MSLVPDHETNRPAPLQPMGQPPLVNPQSVAAVAMFVANCIAVLLLVDAIPNDPVIIRKLVMAASFLLSTYGFRSALYSPPPPDKKG